ncbi:MAG: EAL domain-containing protein [Methylobacterium frigidaeris]
MAEADNDLPEQARRQASCECCPVEAAPGPALARLLELAARLFDVPTVFVSLLDQDRQVLHAGHGLAPPGTGHRDPSHAPAILRGGVDVVLDGWADPRFRGGPVALGDPAIRFCAAATLLSPAGHALGTLCIADTRPRTAFSPADRLNLDALSGLVLDHLERQPREPALGAGRSRFRRLADASPDGIVCVDRQGRITDWNAGAEALFGFAPGEVLGRSIDRIVPGWPRGLPECSPDEAAGGAATAIELTGRHRSGAEVPVSLSLSTWREEGQPAFGAILRDTRERRATEERLRRLAHLDPLTALPDRAALRERLAGLLAAGRPTAVLMLGLDGFKEINDTLGHAAGDAVLRLAAARLLAGTGIADNGIADAGMVARFGGDEFAILLPEVGEAGATATAEALVRAFAEPFVHDGHVLPLGITVGVALSPAHGRDGDDLLSCAGMALHWAKAEGRRCHRLYMPALREAARAARRLRNALHDAVERSEFVLFYQPQVSLADGSLVGAEALLRWQHPRNGLLAPAAFLPALESSPFAAEVGDWVLDEACRQAVRWRELGAPDFRIGVNLSAAQFQRGDLAETVATTLARTNLPPAALELEITETVVLRHDDVALAPLAALRELGTGIAFDDYGTGYASLSLLKRYPLTRLKIDRSFVTGMTSSRQDETIVRAILQLGHGFKLDVIAEGIETAQEHARLRAKGCHEGQGFLFGRPMAAAAFASRYGLGGAAAATAAQ